MMEETTEDELEEPRCGTETEQETRRDRRTQEEHEGKCLCYVTLMEDLSFLSLVTVRSKVCVFIFFCFVLSLYLFLLCIIGMVLTPCSVELGYFLVNGLNRNNNVKKDGRIDQIRTGTKQGNINI